MIHLSSFDVRKAKLEYDFNAVAIQLSNLHLEIYQILLTY